MRLRWTRLAMLLAAVIVYGAVAEPLIRRLGWPTTRTAQIVVWTIPIVVGILLYVTADTYGWWDRTHRTIRRLDGELDFAGIVALDPPLPGPKASVHRLVDSTIVAKAGLLTGNYSTALRHAEAAGAGFSRMGRLMADARRLMELRQAQALLALGRFGEAAALVDDRSDPHAQRLRAQVAIAVGDDALALGLLSEPDEAPLDEGGRLRIIGDLHIKRGRLEEGMALVAEAQGIYEDFDAVVDAAYCTVHLAEADLEAGRPERAIAKLDEAERLIGGARDDNVVGFATLAAHRARALAAVNQPEAALQEGERSLSLAKPTEAPQLIALAHRSLAAAALAGGDAGRAHESLTTAAALLRDVGAQPELERTLAEIDRISGRPTS